MLAPGFVSARVCGRQGLWAPGFVSARVCGVLLPSSGRGVTGRLSLSLEAKALSEDAGGPADDEDVDAAVVLPVSVALSGRMAV